MTKIHTPIKSYLDHHFLSQNFEQKRSVNSEEMTPKGKNNVDELGRPLSTESKSLQVSLLETSLEKNPIESQQSSGPSWVKWLKSSKLMSKKSNLNRTPEMNDFPPEKEPSFKRIIQLPVQPSFFRGYVCFQGALYLTFVFFPNKQKSSKYLRGPSALKSAYISGRMMNCLTSNLTMKTASQCCC